MLKLSAKNPGVWGDDIRLVAGPANKAKTQILEILETEAGKRYVVKNGAGFNPGDVIAYTDQTKTVYNKVVKSQDNILTLEEDFDDTVVDKGLLPTKVIITCEFSLEISYNDIVEVYDNLSFNIQAPSFVEKKMAKSDLVNVQYVGTQDGMVPPFIQLAGEGKAVASISLSGWQQRQRFCHYGSGFYRRRLWRWKAYRDPVLPGQRYGFPDGCARRYRPQRTADAGGSL